MVSEKEKSFVSIIVYVYNNEDNLREFSEKIFHAIDSLFEKYEFIFVNDCSSDRSAEVIAELVKQQSQGEFSLISMGNFQGLEAAMKAGLDLAIGDFIFEFDSVVIDYDVSLIGDVFRTMGEGNDIVIAARKSAGASSKMFHHVFNRFSDIQNTILPRSFSIISRRAVNRIDAMAIFVPYRKAQYAASNLSVQHVIYDNDKSSVKRRLKNQEKRHSAVIDAILLFTNLSYRITMFFSILMAFFMVFSGIYVIVTYFTVGPVPGWAPTMGLISAGFLGVFVILTIMVKYLDLILRTVFRKQSYQVSAIDKLKKG